MKEVDMLSCLVKTDRIETLKNRMLSVPRYASIEQAKIITDTYKAHEGCLLYTSWKAGRCKESC